MSLLTQAFMFGLALASTSALGRRSRIVIVFDVTLDLYYTSCGCAMLLCQPQAGGAPRLRHAAESAGLHLREGCVGQGARGQVRCRKVKEGSSGLSVGLRIVAHAGGSTATADLSPYYFSMRHATSPQALKPPTHGTEPPTHGTEPPTHGAEPPNHTTEPQTN